MILLPSTSVTTPITTLIGGPFQFRDTRRVPWLTVQGSCSIAATSGFAVSCTIGIDIQTSIDGTNYTDVGNLSWYQTGSTGILTLVGNSPVTTPVALTDALGPNTTQQGILGSLVRAKLTSSGTYSASVRVDAFSPSGLTTTS
jgi:hypothetical protein